MAKIIRNYVIVFVLLFVLTLIWHNVAFGGQYPDHLKGIVAVDAAGNPAPRMLFFILAHLVGALGWVLYVPAVARTRGGFTGHGVVMGLVTFGFFSLLSHGLFQNWTTWLMGMDVAYGALGGAIIGFVLSYLAPAEPIDSGRRTSQEQNARRR